MDSIGERRTLKPGLGKWLFVTAIGAVFVAIGALMIVKDGGIMGWITAIFFGLVVGVGLLQLAGYGSQLTLEADTFKLVNFGRTTVERWDECANFAVYRAGHNDFIGYDRARDVGTKMAAINRHVAGRSAGLPDTFGMNAADLAGLMNAYQAQAVERGWQRHADELPQVVETIRSGLESAAQPGRIIADTSEMQLPEGMPAWPSLLVVVPGGAAGEADRVLICVDVLNPYSRWIPQAAREADAFNLLGAEELQIVSPDDKSVRRIVPERAGAT